MFVAVLAALMWSVYGETLKERKTRVKWMALTAVAALVWAAIGLILFTCQELALLLTGVAAAAGAVWSMSRETPKEKKRFVKWRTVLAVAAVAAAVVGPVLLMTVLK
jgi:MFS family permease